MASMVCSVLVVEDDRNTRDLLCGVLEAQGYVAAGTANGVEALGWLRASAPPCLILLDLIMPVMNGWQFRTEQLRDPALASIPVVVVSGDVYQGTKVASIDARGFLKKPVDPERLLEVVLTYCGGAAS
jgi:CheY-like chemotaxis protein